MTYARGLATQPAAGLSAGTPRSRQAGRVAALLAGLCVAGAACAESVVSTARSVTDIAPGVRVIRHPDAIDGFPSGNTTVIEGERSVLVVDSCYLPSQARQDIEDIKRWTRKPVRYLVNTHWHPDHVRGNSVYAEAYPGITIVAQSETKRLMRKYETGNRERADRRLEEGADALRAGQAKGRRLTGKARAELESQLATRRVIQAEMATAPMRLPDLTVSDGIDLDLGNRAVQLRHSGPGDTLGDLWLYLPDDRILVTGDLLVAPVPYFFAGYPRAHRDVLVRLAQLDSAVIVPGHGPIQRDQAYLHAVVGLMTYVIDGVDRAIEAHGSLSTTVEDAGNALDLGRLRQQFAGDDSVNQSFFDESVSGLVRDAFHQAPR